jgi:protein CpxP
MKKHILTFILFVSMVTIGFAQQVPQAGGQRQQGTPEERAKRGAEMMEKNLSLSAEQKTRIYDASLERTKSTEALRAAAGEGNRPDMTQIKALNDKYEAVIAATLTAEQKTKYEEMKAQRGNRGGNGGNGNGNAPEKPKGDN